MSFDPSTVVDQFSQAFTARPDIIFMQSMMVGTGVLLVFFVLFTTRDILLRTHSLLLQIFSIVIVAILPIIGFLLYLLFRPARTNAEKKLAHDVEVLMSKVGSVNHAVQHPKQNNGGQQQNQQKKFNPQNQRPKNQQQQKPKMIASAPTSHQGNALQNRQV